MEAIQDFEDMLALLNKHQTQYLIIGGLEPNRIDLLLKVREVQFETAWKKRIRGHYGKTRASWIDLDCLIRTKRHLDNPRHQEDVRVLLEVKQLRKNRS